MKQRRRLIVIAVAIVVVLLGAVVVFVTRGDDRHVKTAATTTTGPGSGTSLSASSTSTTATSTSTTSTTSTTLAPSTTTGVTSELPTTDVPDTTLPPAPAGPGLGDAAIRLTRVASVATPIAGAVWPGNGLLHIATRDGKLFALNGGLGPKLLDIGGSISQNAMNNGEGGLLGIAFTSSSLFVSYSNLAGDNELDRYAMNGDGSVNTASRTTVLTVPHPTYTNHYGGGVVLGPDGFLYWGLGDGGGSGDPFGNAQNLDTFRGKLVRIEPNSGSAANVDWGLRNPWRFSFDRGTGDLYIADVGQNLYEEIDWRPAGAIAGANFGWNLREGFHPYNGGAKPPGNVDPIYEYSHNDGEGRCAITGGYVYRGARIPALQGAYVFSDLCGGELHGLGNDSGSVTLERDLGVGLGDVESFAEDGTGELYVLSFGSEGVFRVDPA